jgi:hypothetical protein
MTEGSLSANDLPFGSDGETALRGEIAALWDNSAIGIDRVVLDGGNASDDDDSPFDTFVRWYSLLCFFYLAADAAWVLDMSKRGIRVRALQSDTPLYRVILATSLAPLVIALAGYIAGGAAACLLTGEPLSAAVRSALPMLLYLVSAVVAALLLASALKSILALLFLAPAAAFINGVLSGLLFPLPEWAFVLGKLSAVLPGRWLNASLDGTPTALPFALACCAAGSP